MQQLKLKDLLALVDTKEHPDWLAIWEKDAVDYVVAYRSAKGDFFLRAVGAHQKLKTLAKAVANREVGILHGYTPSLAFSIRTLDYQRLELEERIAMLEERESKLRESWEGTPATAGMASASMGDLSLREQAIIRRERELAEWEERLNERKKAIEMEAQFISESEEQLNERFQEFMEREARIEQKEEELQQMAFKLGIA